MVKAQRDLKLIPGIQGDLTLLAAGRVTSYRAGETYTVGHLPFWLWPEWLLRDEPLWIIFLILVAAIIVGGVLYRILWRHAAMRMARGKIPT
jgi:cellulose synthase (UDP-forming)